MQAVTSRIPKPFGGGHTRPDGSARKSLLPRQERAAALQSRLEECLVFVIHKDGRREYRTMTVRALYNHVLEVITQRPQSRTASFDVKTGNLRRSTAPNILRPLSEDPSQPPPPPTQSPLPPTDTKKVAKGADTEHSSQAPTIPVASTTIKSPLKPGAKSKGKAPPEPVVLGDEKAGPHSKTAARKKRRAKAKGENQVTYRERLGGYLHPRDMRRLVTPFSGSNEPEIMVRRHVILLNCDPLRAIVLRDRLLVLVPDGADSILEKLAKRVRGGVEEVENDIFGDMIEKSMHNKDVLGNSSHGKSRHSGSKPEPKRSALKASVLPLSMAPKTDSNITSTDEEATDTDNDSEDDEFHDLQGREWINMPFELQCVDAVLHTVSIMLAEEVVELQEDAFTVLDELITSAKGIGHVGEDILRRLKDDISEMYGRVQGFSRALNVVLDDEEDLALMNLSRLLTNPERFIQPVPLEVLNEESDEPELILEAYLQQGLSTSNQVDLMKGQVATAEELIDMQLDAVRNRLLYINTLLSLLSLVVAIGSFVGSIFGMNLVNHIEDDPDAFRQVVMGTLFGCFAVLLLLVFVFWRTGTLQSLTA